MLFYLRYYPLFELCRCIDHRFLGTTSHPSRSSAEPAANPCVAFRRLRDILRCLMLGTHDEHNRTRRSSVDSKISTDELMVERILIFALFLLNPQPSPENVLPDPNLQDINPDQGSWSTRWLRICKWGTAILRHSIRDSSQALDALNSEDVVGK